ncbi:MAG: phosphoribosyl-ATP diphosphatase [Oscillospiraceae bacterium]|jgi:phosphoribosyl-ATP pyrophosphohydrolase|nr:phosphoribosyl-ATP diphosphatase [Oscillospiraceae bacterium]
MNNSTYPLDLLYGVILERKQTDSENSYTRYLFEQGLDKILKKVGEECSETIIAAKNSERGGGSELLVGEVSDLIYHLMVMLVQLDVPLEQVYAELDARAEKRGNLKAMKTTDKNT